VPSSLCSTVERKVGLCRAKVTVLLGLDTEALLSQADFREYCSSIAEIRPGHGRALVEAFMFWAT